MKTEIQIKLELARKVRALLISALNDSRLSPETIASMQDAIKVADQFIADHYIVDDPARDFGGLND